MNLLQAIPFFCNCLLTVALYTPTYNDLHGFFFPKEIIDLIYCFLIRPGNVTKSVLHQSMAYRETDNLEFRVVIKAVDGIIGVGANSTPAPPKFKVLKPL